MPETASSTSAVDPAGSRSSSCALARESSPPTSRPDSSTCIVANVPEDQIEARVVADVVDLSQFADGEFDAVVCYGGPLSYVMDEAPAAVAELARVTRSGGHVLLSVMSLVGSTLSVPGGIGALVAEYDAETVRRVTATGRLGCRARRARPADAPVSLERAPPCSSSHTDASSPRRRPACSRATTRIRPSWPTLELDLGAEPGAIDVGRHILAVVEVA